MSNSATPELGAERSLRSTTRNNPRRRPRQSDADSQRTAPRRKRSKISEDTFVPPRHDEEEEINGTIEVPTMNGDVNTPSPKRGRGRPRKVSAAPVLDIEMPVRAKKSSVKRPAKGDGATILTQNSRYSVKLLPSTPKDLRREGVEYRGSIGAGHHALAVTRDRAYVWDYTLHGPVSSPKVFDIPFTTKPNDVLPFGALVTAGTSTEVGLVLLSANSGKVVYYESIERAASLGLFQERNLGVEGSLGSLFSGEFITNVSSAHHAGFIITLSSGRIAQLTLRDPQGKARVLAKFLRATDQGSGGLFGSIKGFLGAGAWKRDVSAVHTRELGTRGQMQVISLTEKAELQVWNLDWSGQYEFKGTIDFREVMVRELRKMELPELQGREETVKALDFVIQEPSSSTNAVATIGSDLPLDILILLEVGTPDNCNHALAAVNVEGEEVVVSQVLQLFTYQGSSTRHIRGTPRLLLPKPRHTALIAFEDAVVVKELDDSEANSPEAQLHASYVRPNTFEDTAYMKQDGGFHVLGACDDEDRSSQESAIAFVKGAGLVRVSIMDPHDTAREERISIKTKIEQAVFHGALQHGNMIDFSKLSDSLYSSQDVEQAALEISDEILGSESPFISTTPTSMETYFVQKAQALQALISYVRPNFPTLSKRTTWRLLWNAEKVAAGQRLWKVYEDHVAFASQTKRTSTALDAVCSILDPKAYGNAERKQSDDLVHLFLIHSLHRIDKILTMTCTLLNTLGTETDKSPQTKIRLVKEADQLWNRSLETVFTFRTDHAAAYGILPEFIENGVLTDVAEYSELPEFWTSTEPMLKAVVQMATLSRKLANQEYEKLGDDDEAIDAIHPVFLEANIENPRLIESLCSIYQERINWLASRPSERDRDMAEMLRENYKETRYDQLRELADIAQSEAGMTLAEKYKDMKTLTEILLAEMQFALTSLPGASVQDKKRINKYLAEMSERIGGYFERFGDDWANAFFDFGFSGSHAGVMLGDAQEKWPGPLAKYLRADASRAKMCWINDITADEDFRHASNCLLLAGKDQETKLWAKKVELSMAKLSILAAQERLNDEGAGNPASDLRNAIPDGELKVVAIQENLYGHLLPELIHCIDNQAEVEVAMQKFGYKIQDLHSLKQLLESYLERVLNHFALSADELIDVLTLIDNVKTDNIESRNFQGQEFFLALEVLNSIAAEIPQDRFETLLQLIWKRCYAYDDWVEINNRQKQSDEEVADKLKETAAWGTLYYALNRGLFDDPNGYVRHVMPNDCLGAGCKPEDLSYRWANPDLLDPILHDNRIQDEQLQSYVIDRNLDQWIEECLRDVKATIEDEAEQKAQVLEREREFEASMRLAGENGNKTNGHIVNGMTEGGEDRMDADNHSGLLDSETVDKMDTA